jgi:hypothetical protein
MPVGKTACSLSDRCPQLNEKLHPCRDLCAAESRQEEKQENDAVKCAFDRHAREFRVFPFTQKSSFFVRKRTLWAQFHVTNLYRKFAYILEIRRSGCLGKGARVADFSITMVELGRRQMALREAFLDMNGPVSTSGRAARRTSHGCGRSGAQRQFTSVSRRQGRPAGYPRSHPSDRALPCTEPVATCGWVGLGPLLDCSRLAHDDRSVRMSPGGIRFDDCAVSLGDPLGECPGRSTVEGPVHRDSSEYAVFREVFSLPSVSWADCRRRADDVCKPLDAKMGSRQFYAQEPLFSLRSGVGGVT